MNNYKYPFLFITPFLIIGILLGNEYYICDLYPVVFIALPIILIICKAKRWLKDISIALGIISLGFLVVPKNNTEYSTSGTYTKLEGVCTEILKNNDYVLKTPRFKTLVKNKEKKNKLNEGDYISFTGRIYPIKHIHNPESTDYSSYLLSKNIFSKTFPNNDIQIIGKSNNIVFIFYRLRREIGKKADKLFSKQTSKIVKAICIGDRHDLDKDIVNLFTKNGTVHILSVSGLHTGLIYGLIMFFMGMFRISMPKRHIVALIILWCYSLITGMPPSVIRAATIITFIVIGNITQKNYTPINSIAASAFIILLFAPNMIYSLGFQFSYSAYTGIILIFPLLSKNFKTLNKVTKYILSMLCLTLAAQIASFPLSIYYFHQFPLGSFIANLIVVPIMTILLYTSTISLALPFFISHKIAFITEFISDTIIFLLNKLLSISLIKEDLYPEVVEVILIYFFIIFSIALIYKFKRIHIYIASFVSILLITCTSIKNYIMSNKSEIVVFHRYKSSSIILTHKGYYYPIKDDIPDITDISHYVKKNKLIKAKFYSNMTDNELKINNNIIIHKSDTIEIIDKNVAKYGGIHIITNNSATNNLHHIPQKIIFDGSNNYFNNIKFNKYEIPIINTKINGGIIIKLK